jgi:LysM repeat protein
MKLNFNIILILFLLISTVGFGLTWYFGGFSESKERVKQLERDYKKLEAEKKIAEEKVAAWQEVYRLKDIEDKKLIIEVTNAKKEVMIARAMAAKFESELSSIKGDMAQTRREIEELKNNPKVLTDEELLKDLVKNTTTKEIQKVDKPTEIRHKVLKHETLYSLSKLYNVSITEIIEQNKFLANGLQTGQTLIIINK